MKFRSFTFVVWVVTVTALLIDQVFLMRGIESMRGIVVTQGKSLDYTYAMYRQLLDQAHQLIAVNEQLRQADRDLKSNSDKLLKAVHENCGGPKRPL